MNTEGHYPRPCRYEHPYLQHWEWDLLHNTPEDTPQPNKLDALLNKYAGEIDEMLTGFVTRGDYSSLGILAAFMSELKTLED